MANPVLNEKAFEQARTTWAPPTPGTDYLPPITDGPISAYQSVTDRMTRAGTATATGVLFVLLLVGGVVGWQAVDTSVTGDPEIPGWIFLPLIAGFVLVLIGSFKPPLARIVGPLYALCQGVFLGAISKAYETWYDGIVVQAIGATAAVFGVMWFLYATRIVKVTDKLRRTIIGATLGIALFYLVSMVMSLFGATPPFINSASVFGIAFSVLVVGIAAFNLMLDFDLIDRGTEAGLPKHMEWFAALGLMVTLVWLYLEILRLLSKINRN